MPGLREAVIGAILIGGLMTFGDWVWARFIPAHRALFGVLHGLALCSGIGNFALWTFAFAPGFLALLLERRAP